MSYFQLPIIENSKICFSFSNTTNTDTLNKTLVEYLMQVKSEIDEHSGKWDNYKKYTNPYEFIHTNIPKHNVSVCKYKPISRSFFKLVEINNLMGINNSLPKNCNTYHLAEGPGGFIEAMCYIRNNKSDFYYGMTLIDDKDYNVPGWKKSEKFLAKHKNVIIENSLSKDGDLFKIENLLYCHNKYKNNIDLITGDGGFDFSYHFNEQESISLNLILYQVIYAIAMQKKGGTLILKVFDTFTRTSLDIIYFLSQMYTQVYIVKPNTSRSANSEKYLVCKNFKMLNTTVLVYKLYYKLMENKNITRLFRDSDIPYFYKCKLEEINAIYGQQQIESIISTLNVITIPNKNEKLQKMTTNHINKCISWCEKCKMPYNIIE
tara:strand:- start:17327 stop:18454 length:1128 start_codon:yes stop_codon:yes gene_type:complete